MLKGKTRIELTDMRDGHIDVYEDTNMFTNGIQNLLSYNGILDNHKFDNNLNSDGTQKSDYNGMLSTGEIPTINYFTGGLLLLSDYIDEDVNQLQIPKNNKVVGRACLENNESTQTGINNGRLTKGEFLSSNSYKYTWDFNESQANGTISCVCLTTPLGAVKAPLETQGDIVYPNSFPYNESNAECITNENGKASNMTLPRSYLAYGDEKITFSEYGDVTIDISKIPKTYFKDGIVLIDKTGNCLYTISCDVNPSGQTDFTNRKFGWNIMQNMVYFHKLVLKKYRFPISNFSIFDNRDMLFNSEDLIDTVELTIPVDLNTEYFNTNHNFYFSNDDEYFYVYLLKDDAGTKTTNSGYGRDKRKTYTMNSLNYDNYIFKYNISDLSLVKYWNISSATIQKYICGWKSGFCNNNSYYRNLENGTNVSSEQISLANGVKDICVFDDKLYFFGKYIDDEGSTQGSTKRIYLFCYDLDEQWIKEVKYNGNSIIIVESECSVDEAKYYGNNKGSYNNTNFSLGNPFVSMINSNDSLLITFLENGMTFEINNTSHLSTGDEIAYLKYNNKTNNPFCLSEKQQLDQPLTIEDKQFEWLHYPLKENIFYVAGSTNTFIKSKSKFAKTKCDDESVGSYWRASWVRNLWTETYGIKLFYRYYDTIKGMVTDVYNDYGCYDIIHNPTMLMTINNLSEQIDKKSYQKMRVTYTITEVLG